MGRGSLLVVLASAALTASCRSGPVVPTRPNVLLVTLDTTRADRLGAYGAPRAATPVFDAVAAAGTLFERAWTVTPLTTPAHASVMTGLYPQAHGVRNNGRFRLAEEASTLAEAFAAAGYRTGAFVGGFPVSRPFGFAQGFQRFDDDFGSDGRGRPRSERTADEVDARALPWLREAATSGTPFFAWIHYYDAHDPYEPPPPFAERFRGRPYDGEIAFVDAQLGRVIEALRHEGVYDRTIVALVGDHGEGLGDHGETTHGLLLYEPMIRVPLVLRAPWTVPSGARRTDLSSVVDLAPTLAGLANVSFPGPFDGRDLFAAQQAADGAVLAETFFAAEEFGWAPLVSVRRGEMKWIGAPRPERYDLEADPSETTNLAGRDAAKDVAMTALLARVAQSSSARRVGNATAPIDDDLLARLQSLGYVGGGGTGRSAEGPSGVGRDPKDAVADYDDYLHGTEAINAGGDAVPLFLRLVAGDPSNPEFRLRLGQAYRVRGDFASAEATYRELVRRYPDFYLAYRRLTALLSAQGRTAECRDLWLALRARNVAYVGIDARLAEAFLATGETERALATAEKGLEGSPDDAELLVLAARALERSGRGADALARYRRALGSRPANLEALDGAVALLGRLGLTGEARSLVEDCVRRSAGDPSVRARLASS
jgi:arylsulfatase A-like enzyme/tetratricopeptide (TPR) repeat protein